MSLQDDERRDMARELHDELGPLLFGIRANAVGAAGRRPAATGRARASVDGMLESVEALQQANRRILDRLRPLYIQELGLEKSIQTLLQNARSQAPDLKLTSRIDPRLNDDRRPAFPDRLSGDPGGRDQRSASRQRQLAECRGDDRRTANWRSKFPTMASDLPPDGILAGD